MSATPMLDWLPLWPRVEPLIAEAQHGRRLPPANASGWIGPIRSPLRDDEHPSFSVKPDSEGDPGGWIDHATGKKGSLAELARQLGLDTRVSVARAPAPPPTPPTPPEMTVEEFCRRRKLDRETLERTWRVSETTYKGRPALLFPTDIGRDRIKYLDDQKPKNDWMSGTGGRHLYGMAPAQEIGGATLYIGNGETAVWACIQSRVPAVCFAVGEGVGPTDEMVDQLKTSKFERFCLVYDLDEAGRKGAPKIVQILQAAGLDAVALQLPSDLGHGGDVDDLHRRTGDDGLAAALAALPVLPSCEDAEGDGAERTKGKVTQSTQLVSIVHDTYRLARDENGEPFAEPHKGPRVVRGLRGADSLRAEMSSEYAHRHGKAPSQSALADALVQLEGDARRLPLEPLGLRLVADGDHTILDLGRDDGQAVILSPGAWTVEPLPLPFRRTKLTSELPMPVRGGDLEELRRLLNISPDSWFVLVGWLVAVLFPEMPQPILALQGEQGTGKSTAAKMIIETVDPSRAALRMSPRDPEQWGVTANGSLVIGLDNVSHIDLWLSDALCRAVTGESLVRRSLYTNNDLTVIAMRRCIVLTSIDPGALRGDLADRLLLVELERIDPTNRRTDRELGARFKAALPAILGGLLDLTVQVMAALPLVDEKKLPRMADFGLVLAALDRVTGWYSLDIYRAMSDTVAATVVDGDPVASALVALAQEKREWSGTATELLKAIAPDGDKKLPRGWPVTPRAMSGALRRLAPALRSVGIGVETGIREGRGRDRIIVLTALPSATVRYRPHASDCKQRAADGADDADGSMPSLSVELREEIKGKREDRSTGLIERTSKIPSQPSAPSASAPKSAGCGDLAQAGPQDPTVRNRPLPSAAHPESWTGRRRARFDELLRLHWASADAVAKVMVEFSDA